MFTPDNGKAAGGNPRTSGNGWLLLPGLAGVQWHVQSVNKKRIVLDNPYVQCYTNSLVWSYNPNCNAMDYNLVGVYYAV